MIMIKSNITKIEFLRDWILTIIEFISLKTNDESITELVEAIDKAYERKDSRGLQCVFNDMNEWVSGFSPQDVKEINTILSSKFGFNLEDKNKKDLVKIKAIVDRGCIKNNGEYYLIKGRIDALNGMDGHEDEMDRLDRLMTDYELSKRNNVKD